MSRVYSDREKLNPFLDYLKKGFLSMSEHYEQTVFVNWFRFSYPKKLIFAIPNGGQRNIITAKKLKAEGVVSGVPDLFIPEWNLWVEMKKDNKSRLSQSQKEIIEYLQSTGHNVIVGYGFDDARKKIIDFEKKFL